VVSTKPAGGLTDQVYATDQEALDALPDVDSGNIAIAYLLIQMDASKAFTCNTTEFDSADLTDYAFTAITAPVAAERLGKSSVSGRDTGQGPSAQHSRIGAGWSFDAPAANTKIYIAECW
jgi:hypothetical protein